MIPLLQPARLRGQGSQALALPDWASLANVPNGALVDVSLNTVDDVWVPSPDNTNYPIGPSSAPFKPWCSCAAALGMGPYGTYIAGPGGGHVDGMSTGIYPWSPTSQLWSLGNSGPGFPVRLNAGGSPDVTAPSPASFNSTYFHWEEHPDVSEGVIVPMPSHSYNHMAVINGRWAGNTNGWLVQIVDQAGSIGPTGTPSLYFWDLDTWLPEFAVDVSGTNGTIGGNTLIDNENGHLYFWGGGSTSLFRATLTDSGTTLPISLSAFIAKPSGVIPYYMPCTPVPERGILVYAMQEPGFGDVHLYVLDPSGPSWTLKVSFDQETYGDLTGVGMFWWPDTECLYIDQGTEDFIRVAIPSDWTDDWTDVSIETATGTRTTRNDSGLFQKMRSFPALKGALSALRSDGAMQFYRPLGTL